MSSDRQSLDRFVRAHTAIGSPPLCPELRLHLASRVMPVWEASEQLTGVAGMAPPYWAFAWPGGQALARWVLDNPLVVRGKTVLDFASGCGLHAIAAAKCGASQVTAAEIDPLAGAAIRLNAALNDASVDASIDDIVGQDDGWQVVLAGDVCYERGMADRVVEWLRCLAARGATVVLGDPGRAYQPSGHLTELGRYIVPTSEDLESRSCYETTVWQVGGP